MTTKRFKLTAINSMRFIAYSLTIIAAFATINPPFGTAYADDAEWLAARAQLKEIVTNQNRCQEYWNVNWKFAKKGVLEARMKIIEVIFLAGDRLPGRANDILSHNRDITILAVHTAGITDEKSKKDLFKIYYADYRPLYHMPAKDFYHCINSNWSTGCAQLAVDDRLVPSFEHFAEEIDLMIAHGKTIQCRIPWPDGKPPQLLKTE